MLTALVLIVLLLALASAVMVLGLPILAAVRERLLADAERRLAEAQLQRITSEALLRLIREARSRD